LLASTNSAQETRALGQRLADQLAPGDVVLLFGDMGAGKSEFARGVARGLDIMGPVPSPSFTILNAYPEARIALYHFDWYRVTDVSELYESGLDEIIGEGITLIEWPERAPELWPQSCLHVTVRAISDTQREITLQPMGGFRHVTLEENT